MRVSIEWALTLGGATPDKGLSGLVTAGPQLVTARSKNLLGRLCAEHVECERHAWAVGWRTVGFPSEVEHATAVRMVCVGPRGS